MSVSFGDFFDLPNGRAAALLVAIGYKESINDIIYTHGEMSAADALINAERAFQDDKYKDMRADLSDVIDALRRLVARGVEKLEWC